MDRWIPFRSPHFVFQIYRHAELIETMHKFVCLIEIMTKFVYVCAMSMSQMRLLTIRQYSSNWSVGKGGCSRDNQKRNAGLVRREWLGGLVRAGWVSQGGKTELKGRAVTKAT